MRSTHVAVIGAGSAGLNAYRQARKHTDSILLVDPGPLGTTCARVGCMPSKLLIAAADAAWSARQAASLGIHTGEIHIDGKAVMQRVQEMRDRFVAKVLAGMSGIPEEHQLHQSVRFVADHLLETADGEQIEAERIVIATGSSPAIPKFLYNADDRLLVNDDLFELTDLPESVVVFGPGVIGLELGQALHRLGVRIRMFGVGGAIGPLGDAELLACAAKTFGAEYPLDADAEVSQVERTDAGVRVSFTDAQGQEQSETFDYLLAATGRRPNVDKLGLENTSLELDEHGIPLFDTETLQCGSSSVFIAGDANNYLPLLHEASDEGHIAGDNAGRYPDVRASHRTQPLAVVFSDPQIATVGMSAAKIAQYNTDIIASASLAFADVARAKVLNRTEGMMKVWADRKTGRLLGAELLGPDVEHLAHLLAWAMERGQTLDEMLAMPYYHPVLEEGLRSLLRELKAAL
ncbi:dihydrolipoyl dehydrogenase [Marinobacterium mangrovicola]|uniref:Dihydrolipoamide dehydrogenase n=1 Tax=Marinobacterium mangrovicola TaxID=1476959 RepID=A0A4R1GQA1_9GAMM|nr:dihydrolipoyl dehydrogenase [Marinobacterium mangrovicola]TCK08219.1 dihydrolipoamide dehydrogenase [Marinobacterium mangrovicola]